MFNMRLGQRYRNGGQTSSQAGSFSESLRLVFVSRTVNCKGRRGEHDYQVCRQEQKPVIIPRETSAKGHGTRPDGGVAASLDSALAVRSPNWSTGTLYGYRESQI